ncbi:Ankyrin repeat protein, partial [Giardia duodenalis]
ANAVKAPERRIECISGAARASKPELLTTVPPASSLITGNSSWTDLMRAAANGNIEAVKRHLADKDKKNSDGGTALMVAARAGRVEVVELLDPTNKDRVTALMRAADRNDMKAAKLLVPLQKGKKMMGDAHISGLRISSGTALMMAAAHGHAECIKLLLNREAGMQDEYGNTTLMWAARLGHINCIRLLLRKEAGMQDRYGRTALLLTAYNGYLECAELLLEAEGSTGDSSGWTALMAASSTNHPECVKLLLEKEAGMQDKSGWTALIYAVANDSGMCKAPCREGGRYGDCLCAARIPTWYPCPRHRQAEGAMRRWAFSPADSSASPDQGQTRRSPPLMPPSSWALESHASCNARAVPRMSTGCCFLWSTDAMKIRSLESLAWTGCFTLVCRGRPVSDAMSLLLIPLHDASAPEPGDGR